VLNSDWVSEWAEQYYGKIEHPTIVAVVLTVWRFRQRTRVTWEQVALFKMDLKGAYNLISFKTRFCKLFAVEMVGALVIIFLCGLFGWSATPAAFQVVTRAIVYELGQALYGDAVMYVDDIVAVTDVTHLESDVAAARGICTGLLGDRAVADHKTETTAGGEARRIDVIGYTLDLDKQVVTLSRRNCLKTIYAFFRVDTRRPVAVSTVQQLASLASRYSAIPSHRRYTAA
jgi:hypothetical protein